MELGVPGLISPKTRLTVIPGLAVRLDACILWHGFYSSASEFVPAVSVFVPPVSVFGIVVSVVDPSALY